MACYHWLRPKGNTWRGCPRKNPTTLFNSELYNKTKPFFNIRNNNSFSLYGVRKNNNKWNRELTSLCTLGNHRFLVKWIRFISPARFWQKHTPSGCVCGETIASATTCQIPAKHIEKKENPFGFSTSFSNISSSNRYKNIIKKIKQEWKEGGSKPWLREREMIQEDSNSRGIAWDVYIYTDEGWNFIILSLLMVFFFITYFLCFYYIYRFWLVDAL